MEEKKPINKLGHLKKMWEAAGDGVDYYADDRDSHIKKLVECGEYEVKLYNISKLKEEVVEKLVASGDYAELYEEDGLDFLKVLVKKKQLADVLVGLIDFEGEIDFDIKFETPSIEEELRIKLIGDYDEDVFHKYTNCGIACASFTLILNSYHYFDGTIKSNNYTFL